MPEKFNALAFRLCEAWQKAQRRQHGFTLDEIGAFMAGVVATEEEFTPKIERLHAALVQIEQWSQAYPLQIFPEPDLARAAELLRVGGITLDAVSASGMRHVIEDVGKIAHEALK